MRVLEMIGLVAVMLVVSAGTYRLMEDNPFEVAVECQIEGPHDLSKCDNIEHFREAVIQMIDLIKAQRKYIGKLEEQLEAKKI